MLLYRKLNISFFSQLFLEVTKMFFTQKTREDVEWDLNFKAMDLLGKGKVKKFHRLRQRYPKWVPNLHGYYFSGVNLSGVNLCCANLASVKFSRVNLQGANLNSTKCEFAYFRGVLLTGCDFVGSDLNHADFTGVNASCADFGGANLDNANFSSAHLDRTNFSEASLRNTMFNGAYFFNVCFWRAVLLGANLTDAKYLDSCHFGGATVDPEMVEEIIGALRRSILTEEPALR